MRFEWDEHKNRTNIQTHGIDFRDATAIFRGRVLERLDPGVHHEARWQTLGMTNDIIVFVVYTERGDDTYRLISARKAEPHEAAAYYQHVFGR